MKISVMEFLDSQRMIQELVEVDFSTFSGLHPPASPLDMELLVRLEQKAQTYFENGQPIFFTNVPLLMQQYLAENAFSLYLLCEQNKPQQETLPEPQQETLPEPQQKTLPEQNKPQQKRLPEQNKPQQKTKNKPQRSNTWLFGITNKLRPKWLSGISLILVLILIYWWNVEAKHQQKYQNLLSHAQKYENENKIYEARQFIKDVCSQNIEIQKLIELASKLDAKERQQKYLSSISQANKELDNSDLDGARQSIKDVCSQDTEIQELTELANKIGAKERQQKYLSSISQANKEFANKEFAKARQFIKDVCSQNIEIQKLIELASKLDAKEQQQK